MDVRRYILTGAPGAGKTSIALALRARGHHVIDEAATDIHAESSDAHGWPASDFVDAVVHRQRQRQQRAGATPVQVFDRSPLCSLALARHLGRPATAGLAEELERIEREHVYQRRVFLIQAIGFVTPTAARRITYEDSLRFGRVHEEVYREHGYELVLIPPGTVQDRATAVEERLR